MGEPKQITKAVLMSPQGVRSQAQKIQRLALNGGTQFQIHLDKLQQVSQFVVNIILQNYPDKQVPYHSRWRHFEMGDQAKLNLYRTLCHSLKPVGQAKLGLDLILPSVLVDAGAGPDWIYQCNGNFSVGRSEGLALASLDMFLAGDLSHQGEVETTAKGLQSLSVESFNQFFQVSEHNPLLGVEGRVQLLKSLGAAMLAQPDIFPNQRPGDLVDYVLKHHQKAPTATHILEMVLTFFGEIWPGRLMLDGANLGDTWHYGPLGEGVQSYVPFHKLSQWISYSIIETLINSGIEVSGVETLTGLAEYRNGGLMLDSGLISLRDPEQAQQPWPPSSELIIEWRALTICLLDAIADQVTESLGMTAEQFPLAKVLQGGTWAAGRELALKTRGNLTPPLNILSDATVF